MTKPRYPIVFSDYDDTLTLPDGTITPRTLAAIKAYREAGGTFVVCTGRSYASVKKLLPVVYGEPHPAVPVICFQGGLVADAEGNVIRREGMDRDEMIGLAAEAEARGMIAQVYSGDSMFVSRKNEASRRYEIITNCSFDELGDLGEVIRTYPHPIDKILMIGSADQVANGLKELPATRRLPRSKLVFSRPIYLEAIPASAGKDKAMLFLAKRLGRSADEIAAFGDSNNDMDMLRAAGLGVAVGNARPECKAVADLVAPPVTEDGLARTLESFLA